MTGASSPPEPTGRALPGEGAALPMRRGGQPIMPEEALGVSRRLARKRRKDAPVPQELPLPNASGEMAAFRLPPRTMAFVRARAEMEGRTVTDVIVEALEGYAASSPGSRPVYRLPKV